MQGGPKQSRSLQIYINKSYSLNLANMAEFFETNFIVKEVQEYYTLETCDLMLDVIAVTLLEVAIWLKYK